MLQAKTISIVYVKANHDGSESGLFTDSTYHNL